MSKGAKLKAKRDARGRPRQEGEREPNGRLSRSTRTYEAADKVALKARAMHMRITIEQAKDQRAASFIGVLAIHGRRDGLSEDQYDALVAWQRIRADYLRAIAAPASGLAGEGSAGGSRISDGYIRWCSTARERYAEAEAAIREGQNIHRRENLWAALDLCVYRDAAMWHLVPALRLVGNVLAGHLAGVDKRAEARNY